FFFSSRRRHTRWPRDWSSDVCSSDLLQTGPRLRRGLFSFDGQAALLQLRVVAGVGQAHAVDGGEGEPGGRSPRGRGALPLVGAEIGRASCRERAWRAGVAGGCRGEWR